jgi:hypothetical protein
MRRGRTTGSETAPPEVTGLQGLSQQCDKAATSHSCEIYLASYLQPLACPKPIVAPDVPWFCVSSSKLTSIT